MTHDFSQIFIEIEKQFSKLENANDKQSFISNLKSIARWNEEPMDYEEPKEIKFPNSSALKNTYLFNIIGNYVIFISP